MKIVSIENLVSGLQNVADDDFRGDNIYQFLTDNPIDVDTLSPYFFWSKNCYTRNLIYRDERFELMVLCWEKGQISRVHDHADQMCWMTVPVGRLRGQNFKIKEIQPEKGFCKLEQTDSFELSDCLAAKVELEEPIHQILNLPEFDQRAVSLHIYSRPFESCLSYCRETDTFKSVPLFYSSIKGKLCSGVVL
ncbi:MAG: cysteine dioxygenase family protein [Pyrinomonadaceae bacterium]|nr:cysteine dioxygenase family protein [Pyrinomonadaceae bacterium]